MAPVMLVVDTAPLAAERMRQEALAEAKAAARSLGVSFCYLGADQEHRWHPGPASSTSPELDAALA